MRVDGLDGRSYSIDTCKFVVHNGGDVAKSKYHLLARKLIKEIYHSYMVLEELSIPGTGRLALYMDFYIPNLDVGFEVHGEQHYKFIPHFHKTKAGFIDSLKRDRSKVEWCDLNGIDLIELKYSDSEEEWRYQIERR